VVDDVVADAVFVVSTAPMLAHHDDRASVERATFDRTRHRRAVGRALPTGIDDRTANSFVDGVDARRRFESTTLGRPTVFGR
jgi:hypothetical protein